MSVTEGIGKPIGYALVIGGAIFAAWYLLKDFDWSSLNPFKGVEDASVNIANSWNAFLASLNADARASREFAERNITGGSSVILDERAENVNWSDDGMAILGIWRPGVGDILQNANTEPASALPEAITYTSEEMATMSAGLTSSPGSGYVQRGTSLTGAPLFEVGPWTQAGVYRLDGYDYSIWRNPVSGALDVATIPGQGGSLASFRNWNPGGEVILW